jgi:hypothetical protein
MSIWNWLYEWAADAQDKEDEQRLRLWELEKRSSGFGKANPDMMLATLQEARALAEQLGESWWVLFIDHWRLQALLHYKMDYREVLDIAVKATLEARKPQYATFPQRICLHEDLIYSYLGVDPIGYSDVIEKALGYMKSEVSEDVECRYCTQGCRTRFAIIRGELDQARESVRLTLEMADTDTRVSNAEHHGCAAYSDLCEIAWLQRDRDTLEDSIKQGEVLARRIDNHLTLAEYIAWQALLARWDGDEEMAKRRLRQAQQRTGRVKSVPSVTFFNILAAYHEEGGELEEAWKVREQELAIVAGKGRLHDEFLCRIKRLRLLAQMGQPIDQELALAREAVQKLREPADHQEKIERAARGEKA